MPRFTAYALAWMRPAVGRAVERLAAAAAAGRGEVLVSRWLSAAGDESEVWGNRIARDDPDIDYWERDRVRRAVDGLPNRWREAVNKVYGMDGRGGLSVRAAAAEIGVSPQRVCQLVDAAGERLRPALAGA